MPFDCIKTHMEKVNPTSTYREAAREIYMKGGVLGAFTGVRIRFFLYFTSSAFTVTLLEKLDGIMKRSWTNN